MRLIVILIVLLCSSDFSFSQGDSNRDASTESQAKPNPTKESIEVYAIVKKTFPDGKQRTLAVEKFACATGETKRLEGGEMEDWFVDIAPYTCADGSESQENELDRTVTETDGQKIFQVAVRLKNAPTLDVAETLNGYYETEVLEAGETVPKFQPEIVSNSLKITSGSETQLNQIITMAEAFDIRPTMYKVKYMIGQKGEGGKLKYLSRPDIRTIENQSNVVKVSLGPNYELDPNRSFDLSVEISLRRIFAQK